MSDLPYKQSLVIVPTYNEKNNIKNLVDKLFALYPDISILIVDDNSPDQTAAIVSELQTIYSQLFLLKREGKLGLGTAYVAGFKWALERDYHFVFEMDADFSHDPVAIPDLLSKAQDHDLVVGSRYKDGIRVIDWPLSRLLLSYVASIYTRVITGMPILDATGGFKCFTRKALESLDFHSIYSNGYAFQIEVNYKIWSKGLKIIEVPIIFYERRNGASKMSNKIIIEAIFTVLLLRWKK